jgi:hypothetical protein
MECTCECECYDAEPMECCNIVFRAARKPYTCTECERPILPGERYEQISGKLEGQWGTWRTCLGCQRLRDAMCCCGGMLAEKVQECFGVDIRWKSPD